MLTATPLFTRDDASTYLNNTAEINYYDEDWALLQGTLKSCLLDDPKERPSFELLEKDIFYQCVATLCTQKSDDADKKILALIKKYATQQIIDHRDSAIQFTCLITASWNGRATVVAALLAEGGFTALHTAAGEGFVDCARLLVEAGAELNTQDKYGDTPLDDAVFWDKKVCGEYLRSKGAECKREKYPANWEDSKIESG